MVDEHALEPILEKVVGRILDERLKPVRTEQAETRKELNRAAGLLGCLSEDQFRLETRLLTAFRNFENSIQLIVDPLLKKLDTEREESVIHQGQHDRAEEVEQRVELRSQMKFIQRDTTLRPKGSFLSVCSFWDELER